MFLTGCGKSLHIIYSDKDRLVIDHKTGEVCNRTYSTFNGELWTDYYASPCDIYLKYESTKPRHRDQVQPKLRKSM